MKDTAFITRLSMVLTLGFIIALLVVSKPESAEARAACEFSVGPDHATCCKCADEFGGCRVTSGSGVASCTFEFCSETPCSVGEI